MKKIIALLLALVMVFALVACGTAQTQQSQAPSNDPAPSQDVQPTPDPGPEPATINVIYHPTIGGDTAIATAIAQGYFEE